ncbi:hypothetical protein [Melissospora conviva]|uniref:hypothetical protein n=1 Tax=Melissospora conviva TaxID=3388432 RepID=UPI003C1918DD
MGAAAQYARPLVGALVLVALLLFGAAPAAAADISVRVTPGTVQAGSLVGIQGSCRANTAPATVTSDAFGTVTLQPQGGVLTAAAAVPATTEPGMYSVRLDCPDSLDAATMLQVLASGQPAQGPATGFGGGEGSGAQRWLLLVGLLSTVAGLVLGGAWLRAHPPRPIRGLQR